MLRKLNILGFVLMSIGGLLLLRFSPVVISTTADSTGKPFFDWDVFSVISVAIFVAGTILSLIVLIRSKQ
jgi:hypothetical protein